MSSNMCFRMFGCSKFAKLTIDSDREIQLNLKTFKKYWEEIHILGFSRFGSLRNLIL